MYLDRVAKAFWQVSPRDAGPITVDHRLYKQPIVFGRYPHMPFTSGQNILDPVPLIVPKGVAAHLSAPNQLTAYESRDNLLGNPQLRTGPSAPLSKFVILRGRVPACCIAASGVRPQA